MNRMKKLLALLLVLALGLSLTACGGAKSDIVGTWQGKIDMTEYIISKGEFTDLRTVYSGLLAIDPYERFKDKDTKNS